MMLNGSEAIVATYRYDPFGNSLGKSGSLGEANVYRFSSKEIHANSGMYYYLYRFYDPNLQRWIGRDPLGDAGSLAQLDAQLDPFPSPSVDTGAAIGPFEAWGGGNLYSYVGNSPVASLDPFGLDGLDSPSATMNSAILRGD